MTGGFERKPGGSSLLDDWLAPVAGSAGKQTLTQQLGAGAAPVDPLIASTREKLVARGVKEARLGDLSSVAAIESSLPRGFELLDWIKQGGGRRGSHNRIVSAWNAGQDGLDNRARWPTILHYVLYLDHMARESMGVGYDKALAEMAEVRLAGTGVGGKIPVHPRAVYFCAAAQVGMDVRAGRKEGEGHYIPAGGFKNLLKDIKHTLTTVGTGKVFDGAARVVAATRGELMRMIDVLAAQDEGRAEGVYQPDEHLEPDLQRALIPLREPLAAVGEPSDDAEATSVAARLAGILGQAIPHMKDVARNHGSGSVDPHGPGHALGLAVDMYYGDGDGKFGHQNKGVKAAAWPFLHALIASRGAQVGLDPSLRPSSVGALTPDDGRRLSHLLHDEGVGYREELAADTDDHAESRDERTAYQRYHQQRHKARARLSARRDALGRIRDALPADDSLVDDVDAEIAALRDDDRFVLAAEPDALIALLLRHLNVLSALEIRVRAVWARRRKPELDGVTHSKRGEHNKLLEVMSAVGALRATAGPAIAARRERLAIESARDPYTRGLVERAAQDDRPLFDQPSVMVDAVDDVHSGGSVLQGSHHWVIAPARILESTAAYGEALELDMRVRAERGELARVLGVMAESAAGRAILTAPAPRPADLAAFHDALGRVAGASEAAALVDGVRERVIEPYEDAPPELAALRDRGYFLADDG